ncbi:hypothetical protein RQP54_17635 [Curvibacter sp. APW13]|uniref:hypothetical protein n=1 Tax=Curvibacter sp. APW13 TaxID=3077236 RepID=UPI0028DEE67B|nr:hypothetical protein [Curvibacter sp. APW13]MDT8992698.1 hypothetical protein [Curvibacter sp. APW13]
MKTTTLFALLEACATARIDGFEVNALHSDGQQWTLYWCGKDESAVFDDQPLTFEDTNCFQVVDVHGTSFELELFANARHLAPVDVLPDGDATLQARAARIDLMTELYAPLADVDPDDGRQSLAASLLADIRHWCDQHGVNVFEALDASYQLYLEERVKPRTSAPASPALQPALRLDVDAKGASCFARSKARNVSILVTVSDPLALHQHAMQIATGSQNQLPAAHAIDMLGTADEPKVDACLCMVLDPGVSPPGTSILESTCS